MRKYFYDNLKLVVVLLLIPFQTAMIWNNFGAKFCLHGEPNEILSAFILALFPILAPIAFAVCGATLRYSLEKRTTPQLLQERLVRLVIPLILGYVLVVPVIGFYAERANNGFKGNYLDYNSYFFSQGVAENKYLGNDGLANFWFLAYLIEITVAALIITAIVRFLVKKLKIKFDVGKIPLSVLVLMFIIPWLFSPIDDTKGISNYFAMFLLGYYLLSKDKIIEKCEKYRYEALVAFIFSDIALFLVHYTFTTQYGIIFNFLVSLVGWLSTLAFVGIFKHSLDFKNSILTYLGRQSYSIFIFHLAVISGVGYYVLFYLNWVPMPIQFVLIMTASFVATILFCEALRHIPFVRALFGIKTDDIML